jgi:starch synthase
MTGAVRNADIVHCHTWYTHLAGCLIKQIFTIPLVITTHSLEPQRPWKEEQLGSAYKVSTWVEKTAFENADGVIAVSHFMKRAVHDIYKVPHKKIRVIPNAIDVDQYKPTFDTNFLTSYNIDPDRPYILFVGRITKQKGLIHLVDSLRYLSRGIQVVLCTGAPDTEDFGRYVEKKIREARTKTRNKIIWINKVMSRNHVILLYSHASVFLCPSIYEPFGFINLEAMSCGTPVVASETGGIPEVVCQGETGLLVPLEYSDTNNFEPRDPKKFSKDLAQAVNSLLSSPEKIKTMGLQARAWVEKQFNWNSTAQNTLRFYREMIEHQQSRKNHKNLI